MCKLTLILGTLLAWQSATAQDEDFRFAAGVTNLADGTTVVRLDATMPAGYILYAEPMTVTADRPLEVVAAPTAKSKRDAFSGEQVLVYDHDVTFLYRSALPLPSTLQVAYQGCSETVCFFPQTLSVPVTQEVGATSPNPTNPAMATPDPPPLKPPSPSEPTAAFAVLATATGYQAPAEFLGFLELSSDAKVAISPFADRGLWVTILLILLGGLALNLTPCILPMIPINIAIIGAGAQAGSRSRGIALGATYGAGIALVYGGLGVIVVLTGSQFGTLQSSPWFNLGIAAVFLALAAASFGLLNIDFSRYQGGSEKGQKGSFISALAFGAMAALLAGACVAPSLIFVLVLATDYWNDGNAAGLLMPFLLGIGMALPWPFAGAGLSFLPKPGRWMEWVKYGFGVVILGFALYYGHIGVSMLREKPDDGPGTLAAAFTESAKTGKPVLVDFWATWCKSCAKMEKTTFKDPAVQERLRDFILVKFKANDLAQGPAAPVLQQYNVKGLPTYLVLAPAQRTTAP